MSLIAFPIIVLFILGALAGLVVLAIFVMRLIFAAFQGMTGRPQSQDELHNVGLASFFRSGLAPAILVGVVLLVVLKVRGVHRESVHVSADVAVAADHNLQEVMQELSEAQREIHNAVRDASREIPVVVSTITSSTTESESRSAATGLAVELSVTSNESPPPDVTTTAVTAPPSADTAKSTPTESDSGAATAAVGTQSTSGENVAATEPGTAAKQESGLPVSDEELQKRKSELAAHIGHWVQSLLGKSTQENGAVTADAAQAAESANGDVVVLQLSDQMADQLLGESGHELLKSFNSELPERIRQTYALIPLTPPVDAAVSPMRPLLANGGLEAIANSLVSIVEQAESGSPDLKPSEIDSTAALATNPAMPDWVNEPDGGRIVAETNPILPGDDPEQPLTQAINRALVEHLSGFTETLEPALNNQSRFVRLELDRETAERCIVERFERSELIETAAEGPKKFIKVYALLEFPEAVDKVAVQKIRQSLQKDRIAGLGIIVSCVWLSICSAGCGIRLARNGARWFRLIATPVAGTVSLLLMLGAGALTIAFSTGNPPRPDWLPYDNAVEIHVDGATLPRRG